MEKRTAVLLDTDIGSDVDDSIALSYLLKQPLCELVGVTTVSGEPDKRAAIVDAVCRAAGRDDVPIHVGVEFPLIVKQNQPEAPHYAVLTGWDHREYGKANTATTFLIETIRSRPGELVLLTIGPLTNIALLFAIDPEIPRLLQGVVSMAGEYFSADQYKRPEWNVLCDPHAAAIVFAAPVPLTLIGLDVTMQCRLEQADCLRRFRSSGGPLTLVADMAEIWFKGTEYAVFHDPLAAAEIFGQSFCKFVPVKVDVDINGAEPLGHTTITKSPGALRRAAKSVDQSRFFDHYFNTVNLS